MITALIFYMFATILAGAGVMVISSRNPVHSVLFMIVCFFNAAGLFLLLGAEFLAMSLVIVYVGAVAVLFLFVVMMLDINTSELKDGFLQYLPVGAVVGLLLLVELVVLFGSWGFSADVGTHIQAATPSAEQVTNTQALGMLIYTKYALLFQVSGLILLVAMVGAILLTLRKRPGVRHQKVADQCARGTDTVQLQKVQTGRGI